jgi:hypothetical protein
MDFVKLIHTDIDHERLSKEIFQLIDYFDLSEHPQISLTSLAGENNWINSTGKRHLLKYPERYFNKINEYLVGTYIAECINRYTDFYRWRLMKVIPRATYSIHPDGLPFRENIKLHIPVITNSKSFLTFYDVMPGDNTTVTVHHANLKVGNSYEVNSTGLNTCVNYGDNDRYHIVGVKYIKERVRGVV